MKRDKLVLGLALLVLGCTRDQWQRMPGPDDAVSAVPWFATMKRGLAVQPYSGPGRSPVPGTVPVNGIEPATPFPYTPANARAIDAIKNPAPRTSESILRGKDRYNIYCAVCHGESGDGKGLVAPKIGGTVRNLISDPAKAYSDGRIYSAIRYGFGLMPGYADKLHPADRWQIVNYVRVLQGAPQ